MSMNVSPHDCGCERERDRQRERERQVERATNGIAWPSESQDSERGEGRTGTLNKRTENQYVCLQT